MSSRFYLLLFSALGLALASCQSPQAFPQPTAQWQTSVGQLRYAGAQRSVVGDVVVRRNSPSDFQLEFQSGPGFPLLNLWISGDRARAEGLFARGSWQGRTDSAPASLQSWVQMSAAFAKRSTSRPAEQFAFAADNGDRFAFHFSR